ncbi:MAG: ribonuclease R [Clostridia bacterium]|jgi:ribonuclease R
MNMKEKILESFRENRVPPVFDKDLMEMMEISEDRWERETFRKVLNEMVEDGSLILTRKKKYGLPEQLGYITGRIQGNPKGFGFLIPDNKELEDIYIPAENMNGAMNNDRVMVRMLKRSLKEQKAREGEVYKIIEHANKSVVGTFEQSRHFGFVVPDDARVYEDIYVPKDEFNGARTGFKVVVEITRWPEKRRNPEGRVVEILGHKDDVGTDILSIIRQFELPEEFPEEVLEEADRVAVPIPEEEIARREDLREYRLFTIDGEDAKDLDDAVSLEILKNGNFLLGVHIADVSYYVRENKNLDKEALARGTSVYLVDRVIPMLPPQLSNGICSLNPGEDRLALSVFMEINEKGQVVDHRIRESVIRSVERMTYDQVTKILEDKDPDLIQRYSHLLEDIRNMEKLCRVLRNRGMQRGSIDFDLDEAQITLDLQGKSVNISRYERSISNQIIEEFMLLCNETIAEHMYWNRVPFIYRVHEEPDTEKLLEFNEFIHNFGYHLKGVGGHIHPKSLQDLLTKIRDTREEGIISKLMLRSLQKAKYSDDNLGHFGLAARYYCHFTAPIRRYPDLMIHRIIKDFIGGRLSEEKVAKLEKRLPDIADRSSIRERVAMEAEWATEDLKKAEYMMDKIGNEYDGIISGVTAYGLYVELENTVEGLVRVHTIEDDYYIFEEKHYCLVGERTRKIYRLGGAVRIKVSHVDIASRRIDFVLVDVE